MEALGKPWKQLKETPETVWPSLPEQPLHKVGCMSQAGFGCKTGYAPEVWQEKLGI